MSEAKINLETVVVQYEIPFNVIISFKNSNKTYILEGLLTGIQH
jgi:hypothetical protein